MSKRDGTAFIAEEDGDAIGLVAASMAHHFVGERAVEHVGVIAGCWVDPGYRMRGTARALTSAAGQWMRGEGAAYAEASYQPANHEIREIWEALGYEASREFARKRLE